MPIPDNQALRKLPKDFVWGYATGERRLTKRGWVAHAL